MNAVRHATLTALRLLPLAALFASAPLYAQYKVVGPDGKVTYTDRPPASTSGKVSELGGRGGVAADNATLPLELRQAVSRYPVTLYASAGACDPCDSARQLLRQRGIPYSERSVQSQEDADALERLSGGRDAPTLSVGAQTLRGLAPEVWNSYLDAAGYPRESRLPPNFAYAPATPLVTRAAPPAARAAETAPAERPAAAPVPPANSNIKF
jgi:glutaredoxin